VFGRVAALALSLALNTGKVTRESQTVTDSRALALFLQIAMEFAGVDGVILPSKPVGLAREDKLTALRRLDKSRAWNSLDDQL
jgi:hypothetical protein